MSSQEDPEARFRTYGKDFGKRYILHDLVDSAPRVRVRSAEDRARDQLADLAVLNERLAGAEGECHALLVWRPLKTRCPTLHSHAPVLD